MTSTKTCRTCGQPRGQGSGRGLCKRCYNAALKRGELTTRPRHHRPLAETVALYDELSAQGLNTAEIAARLGIKRASLSSALARAGYAPGRRQRAVADRIVDKVAIRRCLAGTLDGRRLTDVEREQAVLRLWRRSATSADIARRVGVSVVSVLPTVERHSPSSGATGGALVRATPGTVTCDQAERARHTVAAAATDTADARELLVALGLVAKQPAQGESAA